MTAAPASFPHEPGSFLSQARTSASLDASVESTACVRRPSLLPEDNNETDEYEVHELVADVDEVEAHRALLEGEG